MKAIFALALLAALTIPATAQTTDIRKQTRTFLDAYARGDRDAVLALTAGEEITVYGSDNAEVFHGTAAVAKLLADDQRLWGGPAHIGAMEHLTLFETPDLASIFFDAPFTAAGRPPLTVRFAMVWRRTGSRWLIVQSSNVVPTVGQSAEQLLSAGAK